MCVGFRPSQVSHPTHRSRQSLNSPSPGGTEMDLLVMRERPRKGIRNSGYDVSVLREKRYKALAKSNGKVSKTAGRARSQQQAVAFFG